MLSLLAAVASTAGFPLTVESIMRGPALVGHAPRGLRWSPDGATLSFQWAKADGTADPAYKGYTVKRDGTGLAPASRSADFGPSSLAGPTAYESGGDIYLANGGSTKRLTKTLEREESPVAVEGGKGVIFVKGGNLYRIDLEGGAVSQLTDITAQADPAPNAPETPLNDSQKALQSEQTKLFKDFPRTFGGFRNFGANRGSGRSGSVGATLTIPKGWQAAGFSISPSGKFAALQVIQPATGVRTADVPNYVTRSGYTETIPTYEKVGDVQTADKMLVIDLVSGAIAEFAPPRRGTIASMQWMPNGGKAVAWAFAEDHKDAWILGFDEATGKPSTLWTEHNDAWVGGPGQGSLGWLPDGSRAYFESENTGFAHLMTMAPDGSDSKALTQGKFEVSDVQLDPERKRFVFISSEGSPFKRHIDALPFEGGAAQKLADISADEDATFAMTPDGKEFAVVKSEPNRPAELFVNGKQVTTTPSEEWLAGPWIVPQVVMVKASDGVDVPARLYKSSKWKKGGPAVIFVHGAGYLQNIYDGWSHYYREYMFHHVLMDRGYALLDMDYRGSAGYGGAWRTAIYRHMGGRDLDDQVDGAAWLVRELGVAKDRIGIYGGSYGGFITLMAMFTKPDTFAAGAALRPVTDWAHYNHGYTSDILNVPQSDPEAYRQSSPIYFAEGLKGALLICHGMVDTNVHFQDTVRLVERLIELGKTNWDVAPYPIEDHTFRTQASWTDEYRRILALFERTIGAGNKGRGRA